MARMSTPVVPGPQVLPDRQATPHQPAPADAPRLDETFIIEAIDRPPSRTTARMAMRHATWKPGILNGLIPFLVVLAASWWWAQPGHGPLGWVLTVLWSWPILSSLVGIYGAVSTRISLRRRRKWFDDSAAFRCNDMLVVVVPTIGRHDTYPALERSVLSYVHHLPACFPSMRVDIITEEGCEAQQRIRLLAARSPLIRVVTVPKRYTTANGTRFKARANHYSHELRIAEGEARDDVWVLHMDDDTGVALDTAIAMAQFIERQRWAGDDTRHLAQGILTYPRENAANMLTWLADAVRPADDIARFAAFTGAGTPLSGLHGELLLVRASIEATIGWDFGPKAIVEDAQLALTFCKRYPGRSAWFQGRCYGASPATVQDFIKQRERWAWGLVGLACNRTIPLRHRIFLAYSVVSWVAGPLQHVAFVLLVGALLGDMNTTPVSLLILPLWAINMGYTVWMYLEGLKINARVSEGGRRRWWEPIAVLLLIPVFSLLEGIGGFRGFVKFVRRAENKFVVIAKPV
ncbi:MAG TPA: glycosyltransferase family 2 protein [Actinoplanes sp.]